MMIAIALACAPRLLLADEPTTGLDVTVQAQILDLLGKLQHDREMAMILVTHDLGVVATRTDDIIVMYAGNVVEHAPTNVLFKSMAMPYTEALLDSMPRLANPSHTRLTAIEGRPPDLLSPPPGCPFARAARTRGTSATPRSRRWWRRSPATATPAGTRCPAARAVRYPPSPRPPPPTATRHDPGHHRRLQCRPAGRTPRQRHRAPGGHGVTDTVTDTAAPPDAGAAPAHRRRPPRDVSQGEPGRPSRGRVSSPCARARRSGWWANPGAGRRPRAAPSCRLSGRPRAVSASATPSSPPSAAAISARCARRCR